MILLTFIPNPKKKKKNMPLALSRQNIPKAFRFIHYLPIGHIHKLENDVNKETPGEWIYQTQIQPIFTNYYKTTHLVYDYELNSLNHLHVKESYKSGEPRKKARRKSG
ncbi:hypothetical protein WUBG_06443 [Wuchereria bancrofti]|uniref:Uncharacterized protein n=1 Tax=Wuchereria bancrofti TaxID=6293 RepID=J9EKF0_WUCBA|nr:hypothetical protein WUBG_06443 [Wuchereria bancrofti]